MKTDFLKFLIFLFVTGICSSCLWNDEEEDTIFSSDPTFVSLKFDKNDSIPGLEYAAFSLEYDVDLQDTIIVNLDSLPYQTRIDSVFPSFAFRSSYLAYLTLTDSLEIGLDTLYLTGNDTVDFTKVQSVTNFARDGETEKTYPIKVNVHQVEPELYNWEKKLTQIYTHSAETQKAVFFNQLFYLYVGSGATNYLYTSTDALQWNNAAVTGLPANARLTDMVIFNDTLYLAHNDGLMYVSKDGYTWLAEDPAVVGYAMKNLLFVLENTLWSLVEEKTTEQLYFATSTNGSDWQVNQAVPDHFPVADFAALSFSSRTNKPKALVMGGYAASGELLPSAWSVQRNVEDEYIWVNFADDNPRIVPSAGAALIQYDDKLLMFGGMDADDTILDPCYMESLDEGLSWGPTDSVYNVLADSVADVVYEPRSYQSVIHNPDNHFIYLIGGKSQSVVFADVWAGRLNRLTFIRK